MRTHRRAKGAEWPTLGLIISCYALWAVATSWLAQMHMGAAVVLTAVAVALYSSLQHEIIHGHPFANRRLNEALVFPGLSVLIPYVRFRDTHLAHHRDAVLTDPFDDPEANYLDGATWEKLPAPLRLILSLNNTLLGRVTIGVAVSQAVFMYSDAKAVMRGDRQVLMGWLWHIPAVALVGIWLWLAGSMTLGTYMIAAYAGLSLIKIRTFLEHQAHERARGRTVIIEDRGPLALLFLNNNLHVVHHMHPAVPWYRLQKLYRQNRERYQSRNGGYVYRSYAQVFRRHLIRAKDPVAHPLWRRG